MASETEKPTPWHPQPGERVLVEAVVRMDVSDYDDIECDLFAVKPIGEYDGTVALVPLSSLRPLPVQGEGVGK